MALDNRIKTFVLLLVLTAIVLFIGGLFGRAGLMIAFALAIGINLLSYFYSHKLVLAMYRAKPASMQNYKWLHSLVEDVARKAKISKPKVYIIPTQHLNAFATGRSPQHAVVAFTEGILHSLDKEELRGVTAHEISHVKNRDILIASIAAMLATVIMFLADMMRRGAFTGSSDDRGGNVMGLLALSILAPLAAILIQSAISRSREFHADETGAILLRNGKPLADALLKLEKGPKLRGGNESSAHLFIVNPFSAAGFVKLFSTHPPVDGRVKRLRSMNF